MDAPGQLAATRPSISALLLKRPLVRGARELARHGPDRILHALRRWVLVSRLRAAPLPRSVLFVCEGNIYRSPYAARVLARALPPYVRELVRVSSAGFVGPGRPSPADAVRLAARRGVELEAHRSSLVTGEVVRSAGLIVVMDSRQRRALRERFRKPGWDVVLLGDLDPEPIRTRAVADPWSRAPGVLEDTYSRVERCVAVLAEALVAGAVED